MGTTLSTKRASSAMVLLGVTALEVAPKLAFAFEGDSFGEAMAVSQPLTRQKAIENGFAKGTTWSDVEEEYVWSDTDDESNWPPRDPKDDSKKEIVKGKRLVGFTPFTTQQAIERGFVEGGDSEEESINENRLIRLMGKHNSILSRHGISSRRLKKNGTDGDSPAYSGPESEANGISAPSASDGNSDGDMFIPNPYDLMSDENRDANPRSYVGPTKFPKRSERKVFWKRLKDRVAKTSETRPQVTDKLYELMELKHAAEREIRRIKKKRREEKWRQEILD